MTPDIRGADRQPGESTGPPFITAWHYDATRRTVTDQVAPPATGSDTRPMAAVSRTSAPIVLAYHDINPHPADGRTSLTARATIKPVSARTSGGVSLVRPRRGGGLRLAAVHRPAHRPLSEPAPEHGNARGRYLQPEAGGTALGP